MFNTIDIDAIRQTAATMTDAALEYSICDCREAIVAFPEGEKVARYAMEMQVYRLELGNRKLAQTNLPKWARHNW